MGLTLQSSYRITQGLYYELQKLSGNFEREKPAPASPPTNTCKLLALDRTEKLKCYRNTKNLVFAFMF